MSTVPAFIVHDGKLDNMEDLEAMGLREGHKLFLVSANSNEIVLRREQPMYRGMTVDEYMAGWRNMLGVMPDGKDTTEERIRERAEEAERERRKFGD